ncbi:unnamed protein product [Cyprideis torosa]|uniref:Uncharacterized protein n=1 Tax=Cyprideis torosa TaxID=163714 RepID=A0A7R8ZPL0_9CRUS|nr:unnamed protein product [Cyprideis torosa]CAG0894237.1 unnamed protein product [Cyprideis torosa]
MKTYSAKASELEKKWLIVDAKDVVLGRLATIVATRLRGTYIGDDVTVGHGAILHACTVGNECLIGMGAVILDEAVIEPCSMVAAGAVVAPGKVVKSGQIWGGNPARYMRDLKPEELDFLKISADNYVRLAAEYKNQS